MSRSLKLATTGGRTPAREALAAAISDRDKAAQALANAQEAAIRARRLTADAQLQLEDAVAAVEVERRNHASNLAAALCSGLSDQRIDAGHPLRTARSRATDCADALEAAKQALEQVESRVRDPEQALELAEEKVRHAATAVLSDETQQWPRQMQEQLDDFANKLVAFAWLIRRHIIDDADPLHPSARHADAMLRHGPSQTLLRRCQDLRIVWRGNDLALHQVGLDHPAAQAWQQTLERLQQDPDAELP